jgi:hypothetical protein
MRISSLALAVLAGFLGGAVGSHMTVYAQAAGVDMVDSRNFVLLDSSGHKRGEWTLDPSGQPVLRLFDAQGGVVWQAGKAGAQLIHQP